MSRDVKGENNPFNGKTHSWETRAAMSASKSGIGNLNYLSDSDGRYYFDASRAAPFESGISNPKWKGTYILDVNLSIQYGPFSKADTLSIFHISSSKYYTVLNTNDSYKGYKYRNSILFSVTEYGLPILQNRSLNNVI
jgi:hypothetical protein